MTRVWKQFMLILAKQTKNVRSCFMSSFLGASCVTSHVCDGCGAQLALSCEQENTNREPLLL